MNTGPKMARLPVHRGAFVAGDECWSLQSLLDRGRGPAAEGRRRGREWLDFEVHDLEGQTVAGVADAGATVVIALPAGSHPVTAQPGARRGECTVAPEGGRSFDLYQRPHRQRA